MDAYNDIRIIDLHPGDNDSDIHCTMRVSRLERREPYEALSYVWGKETSPRQITVSGQAITITQNLYQALRRLRMQASKRALWIDQLCIDQGNVAEKTRQVNMMRKIYKMCTRCIIWLGEIPVREGGFTVSDAQGAMDYLRFCARLPNHQGLDIPDSLSTAKKCHAASKAFRSLFRGGNAWWSRIWTVQEAVIPSLASLYWGPLTLDWSIVRQAASNICKLQPGMCEIRGLQLSVLDLDENFLAPVRGLHIAESGEDPLDLLQRWRYRDATDPRDKVYGLMGLYKTIPLPSVQSCDYQTTVQALYTNVTSDLIRLEKGLRPLVGSRRQKISDLPTWVIDFSTSPNTSTADFWWNHSHRYKWFNADNGKHLDWETTSSGSVLSLKGIHVDQIEQVGNVHYLTCTRDASRRELEYIVHSWKELLLRHMKSNQSYSKHPYGDSLDTAFWMTMAGDLITNEFPIRRGVTSDVSQIKALLRSRGSSEVGTSLRSMVINQAFFITKLGYIGIGPPTIKKGDEVWVLFGGQVPFILRPIASTNNPLKPEQNQNTLVGGAFVYGLMDGEATVLPKPKQTVHIH